MTTNLLSYFTDITQCFKSHGHQGHKQMCVCTDTSVLMDIQRLDCPDIASKTVPISLEKCILVWNLEVIYGSPNCVTAMQIFGSQIIYCFHITFPDCPNDLYKTYQVVAFLWSSFGVSVGATHHITGSFLFVQNK